jgi:plasmid stability protein
MVSITVRNIPDEIIDKIKVLSEIEKRSLNNEILVILERGLSDEIKNKKNAKISAEAQVSLWRKLSGLWEDTRPTEEIISDIYSSRSKGRDVEI